MLYFGEDQPLHVLSHIFFKGIIVRSIFVRCPLIVGHLLDSVIYWMIACRIAIHDKGLAHIPAIFLMFYWVHSSFIDLVILPPFSEPLILLISLIKNARLC